MTLVVALAIGPIADELEKYCRGGGVAVAFARHDEVAVAWAADSPWITTHDDGDVLVVLDGRLHNLPTRPVNQAEVLGQRYRASGIDLARGLLGDFVLIVVDRGTGRTLVARDPVGVRPWYHAGRGQWRAGASNLATLAALPSVELTVNEPIAIEYLAAVEESRGETLYRDIRTLRPGETWTRFQDRDTTSAHHRWDLEPELDISWDDAAARCREVLDEAVRCRLDVAGAAATELSGGLDSSIVAGTAVLLGRGDIVVGRLLFDSPGADERAYSDAVVDHWGLRAISTPPFVPTEDEVVALGAALRRPVPDANFTMFSSLHRALVADGRPDMLTGLGGDDAFISMGTAARVLSAVRFRQPRVLSELLGTGGPRRAWQELVRPTLGYFVPPRRGHGLPSWVSDTAVDEGYLRERVRRRPPKVTGVSAIDERLGALTSGYDASILETSAGLGDLIGRRGSHPYLDPRFIAVTYGLDPSWPAAGGHTRALQVDAFRDRLPVAVAERRSKVEFSEVFWPQVMGDGLLDRVRHGPLAERGWLDPAGFEVLVSNATRGMTAAAIPLFRCVALDRWMRVQR